MYYFEFAIIIAIFVFEVKLRKKITSKKFILAIIAVLCIPFLVYGMVLLMYKLYPSMTGSLSLKGILKTTSQDGYTGRYDLNRLSFVKGINKTIFLNDRFLNTFGLGIGMANVNSDFSAYYMDTHYTWFSSAYVYIENGTVGLLLYLFSFFIPVFFAATKKKRFVLCTVIMITMLIFYNETMKTEACYLIMFLLAGYFVEYTKNQKKLKVNYYVKNHFD